MAREQGRLDRRALERGVESGEIETVVTAFPDLYGRLVGKRITGAFFLEETADHGMHVCDYLLACDMEMDPVPGYAFASWQKGYGDVLCRPDFATLRRAAWLEKSAIVLCDVFDARGQAPVAIAPRRVLQRQLERLRDAGFVLKVGSELEFFAFRDSYASAQAKGFERLETFGSYVEDYHLLQGTKIEPLVGAIRRDVGASGIPVEFSKGEWGPGQQEINLRYAEALEMSDRHVLYKHAAKEIAHAQNLAITFMAKWSEAHAGSSMHAHTSLWDAAAPDRSSFAGDDALGELAVSKVFRHWLAGLLAHTPEITLFLAPNVNSYKRFAAGTFAPTAIGWSFDNRTAPFRVVGEGASLRVECRIPGADANPYLVCAVLAAAGLDGLTRELEPEPPLEGNLYDQAGLERLPRTLGDAIALAERSSFLKEVLGAEVLEHYLHFARTEKRKFDEVVTSYERARFLERG